MATICKIIFMLSSSKLENGIRDLYSSVLNGKIDRPSEYSPEIIQEARRIFPRDCFDIIEIAENEVMIGLVDNDGNSPSILITTAYPSRILLTSRSSTAPYRGDIVSGFDFRQDEFFVMQNVNIEGFGEPYACSLHYSTQTDKLSYVKLAQEAVSLNNYGTLPSYSTVVEYRRILLRPDGKLIRGQKPKSPFRGERDPHITLVSSPSAKTANATDVYALYGRNNENLSALFSEAPNVIRDPLLDILKQMRRQFNPYVGPIT